MLNSAPLNTWPLNALGGAGEHEEPIIIPTGHAFRWTATVTMGGIDVTELLTGSIRVDREEGAAGLAEFELFYPVGTAVVTDIADRTVTIDYTTDDGQGATQVRLFTGLVAEPSWDAPSRVMRITATDNLQQKLEAQSIAQIDALTAGVWSADIFEPVDGRSRWDYAQERMSSRQAALDCDVDGYARVTDWLPKPAPDYIFGAGTTIYESIDVKLAQLRNVTNRVEVELNYRYARLQEAQIKYKWVNPQTGGSTGILGFCNWRMMSTELPDKSMIYSATNGASLVPVEAYWYDLPPTMPDPCGNGQPWINRQADLLLGAEWTGARRWSQSVTETYRLTLATHAGMQDGQQVISRTGYNISIDSEHSDGWPNSLVSIDPSAQNPVTPLDVQPGDQAEDNRRIAAIECALSVGQSVIIGSHRQTQVSWSVPTSMALGVDLAHTVELDDQSTKTKAKCSRRVDELSFETGSAITRLTLSVMRGGGESDPLTVPARLGANDYIGGGSEWDSEVVLASQFGGRFVGPIYNDELDGFAGDYSAKQDATLESFPRRMAITAPQVDETLIDEKTHELSITYSVGVPVDLLEL